MENLTLEYIAGFFDGEGSIGIYYSKTKERFHLRTQLTQNKNKTVTSIMEIIANRFGGNISEQSTISGGIKYNWQLNSHKAVSFLEEILPFLRLKLDQAKLAIEWQKNRPLPKRDNLGRIRRSFKVNRAYDVRVANELKRMKQVLCVKG